MNAESYVLNNGFTSNWFPITRSVRQGCCRSVILFLILVEILGAKIRNNPRIIGIRTGNCMKCSSQYADDIWASVIHSQAVFDDLLQTFYDFHRFSGLCINYDKTQVLRVGSLRHSDAKLYSLKPLQWSRRIKVLGLIVTHNTHEMIEFNTVKIKNKIQGVVEAWQNRSLSIIGKILVSNSLLISQAAYTLLYMYSPDKTFFDTVKKMIIKFIWDNKTAKIAYRTMLNPIEKGGLKLIDLEINDVSLKTSWVAKTLSNDNRDML